MKLIQTFLLAIIASLLVSSAKAVDTEKTNYDNFLQVTNASQCFFSEDFEQFWKQFFTADSDGSPLPGNVNAPSPYDRGIKSHKYVTFDNNDIFLTIETDASWHGFSLIKMNSEQPAGGDPASISWTLEGNHNAIRSLMIQYGFKVNTNGHTIYVIDSVYDLHFYIIQDPNNPNLTEISCSWL